MSYVTFDPYSPAQVRVSLSNGNLTATFAGAAFFSPGFALSTEGKSSGKWYWEITCGQFSNPSGIGVSNCLPGCGGTRMFFDSTDSDGVGYFAGGGIYRYGTFLWSTDTYTSGDVICIAMDCDNNQVWFRKNNGSWRGASSSAADPATNTNGIDLSTAAGAAGGLFAGINGENHNDAVTANFGASAFTYSAPSGFTAGFTATLGSHLLSTFAGYAPGGVQAPPGLSVAVSQFTLAANQDITDIDFLFRAAATQNIRLVVYADNGGVPTGGAKKGITAAKASVVKGINKFAFASPLQLTAGSYWVGPITDANPYNAVSPNATLTNGSWYHTATYSNPDDPFPSSPTVSHTVYPMRIFYTAYSGGGGPKPQIFIMT